MTRFEVATAVAAPPGRVFDVSLEIGTHLASMAGSGERVVGGVASGRMELGDTVTWQARHFGVRWRHAHHFESDGDGGTVMRDGVDFAAPLGPLGIVVQFLVLDRYMARLIRVRNEHVKAVAEAGY